MKIQNISLKDYNQFKDIEIDLTYPKGHEKAGRPLDKICFIGQSGTGKSSLLRLIKYFITSSPKIGTGVSLPKIEQDQVKMLMTFDRFLYERKIGTSGFVVNNKHTRHEDNWNEKRKKAKEEFEEANKPILINFPTERLINKNKENAETNEVEITEDAKSKRIEYLENLKPGAVVDFAFEDSSKAWEYVLSDIKKHQVEEFDWRNKISNIVLKPNSKPADFEQINAEYKQWLRENPNPLEVLAQALDNILRELGVKIKTDIDKESILHLGSVQLQTLDGSNIPRDFWSTGTKQIIDTAMPLFEIKPKKSVILIDEPERSLYPNLQQKIVDFYTELGDNCQFFYATHSPIIASSFDPWEIVELKFDESNMSVVQELNYTGERHVDNYTVYPKYLKWDEILMKLFDLTDEGNNTYRLQELMKVVSLRNELNELKANGQNKGEAFEKKVNDFVKLQNKVGWNEKA